MRTSYDVLIQGEVRSCELAYVRVSRFVTKGLLLSYNNKNGNFAKLIINLLGTKICASFFINMTFKSSLFQDWRSGTPSFNVANYFTKVGTL